MTLLAAYNFDEASGAVVDVTGNGHDFTITSNITRQTGHTNTGLRHETTAANSGGPTIFGQTAQRTTMCWVKRTSNSVDGWIVEMKDGVGDTGLWGFLYTSSGAALQARCKNPSSTVFTVQITPPAINTWYHAAMTFDGAKVHLFINGVEQGTGTTVTGGSLHTGATIFPFFDTVGTETVIDDVRVYDTALDAATITTLMGTPVTGGGGPTTHVLTADGSSSATGSAELSLRLVATGSGSGTPSGSAGLSVRHAITASGSGTSAGSASLSLRLPLNGSGSSTGTGSAALTLRLPLAATGASAATGSAALTVKLATAASGAAIATGSADLTLTGVGPVTHVLTATGAGTATGSAALRLRAALTASGTSTSAGSAALIVRLLLSAAGASTSLGSAYLTALWLLMASGSATSTGSADLVIAGPLPPITERPFTGSTSRPIGAPAITIRPDIGTTSRP